MFQKNQKHIYEGPQKSLKGRWGPEGPLGAERALRGPKGPSALRWSQKEGRGAP